MSKKILIVQAPFYTHISEGLLKGAISELKRINVEYEIFSVPGALEIPAAIFFASKKQEFDGYIALGCVIKGKTAHFEIVAEQSARGLMDLSLKGFAIGQGILTVYNEEQALERADIQRLNKGGEAAKACLSLIDIKDKYQ
jgi:6,7-dimethyl-8-ribityllumazine synthase